MMSGVVVDVDEREGGMKRLRRDMFDRCGYLRPALRKVLSIYRAEAGLRGMRSWHSNGVSVMRCASLSNGVSRFFSQQYIWCMRSYSKSIWIFYLQELLQDSMPGYRIQPFSCDLIMVG